jgi:ABC-type dipeptide/oligopeptide/nickel transport system permease component
MLTYAVRRIAWMLLILLVITVITFVLSRVIPANPAVFVAGYGASKAEVARITHQLGLDQPLYVQYGRYLAGLAHLDFGKSIRTGRPVGADLKTYLPATLELIVYSFVIYLLIALPLGMLAALRRGTVVDLVVRGVAMVGSAAPIFWIAIILQLLLFSYLGLLPIGGRLDIGQAPPPTVTGFYTIDSLLAGDPATFAASVQHLILPMVSIVLSQLAVGARLMRSTMIQELRKQYVGTARSKGLTERQVVMWHVLRNALNPVVTMAGIQLGYLFAWIILVETIFQWPGIGLYAYQSFAALDYSPIMALTLVSSFAFVMINLVTDLIYPILDPRVGYR